MKGRRGGSMAAGDAGALELIGSKLEPDIASMFASSCFAVADERRSLQDKRWNC